MLGNFTNFILGCGFHSYIDQDYTITLLISNKLKDKCKKVIWKRNMSFIKRDLMKGKKINDLGE